MSAPLIVPGLLLAALLLLSAVAKLRAPQATADAFVSLQLPQWLRRSGAPRVLPYAEIVLALALLVTSGTAYVLVAAVALLLFLAYLAIVARAVGFDPPVSCACFGNLGLGLVDRATVVRNAVLTLAAALVLVDAARQGLSIVVRLAEFGATGWAWLGMVALGIGVTALVVRSGGQAPSAAPAFVTDDDGDLDYVRQPIPFGWVTLPSGERVTLRELAATGPQLLLLTNLACASCLRVIDGLPRFVAENPEVRVRAVFSHRVDRDRIPEWLDYVLDDDGHTRRVFQAATPAAVLLGADGQLAGGPVVGEPAVQEFLKDVAAELADVRGTLPATGADSIARA